MIKFPSLRVAYVLLTMTALTMLLTPSDRAGFSAGTPDLVVHEWGTFTSVIGREGQPLPWRPLRFESDVPKFVYSVDQGSSFREFRYPSKSLSAVTVRMETPVLYFYCPQETEVSAKVSFPHGKITEWYPTAQVSRETINWPSFKIIPDAQVTFQHDSSQNHYYPARQTDGVPIQVPTKTGVEHEKFLFYRGVGDFSLPVHAKLVGEKFLIQNTSNEPIGKVILFRRHQGRLGFTVLDLALTDKEIDPPLINGNIEDLRSQLKGMLIEGGLYEKEAEAMLNTWRDSWFEAGTRVFYIMPRKVTDVILPLSITPQPTRIERVLVGRTELITPEMEKIVTLGLARFRHPSAEIRTAARKEMNQFGRFLEPILTEILRHNGSAQVRSQVEALIDEMN